APAAAARSTGAALAERPRWAGSAIPVWIEKSPRASANRDLVRRALRTWSAASHGAVMFREVEEFPGRGIRVRFAADEGYYGQAVPYTDDETGHIVRADVLLAADVPGDELQRHVVTYLTALHE